MRHSSVIASELAGVLAFCYVSLNVCLCSRNSEVHRDLRSIRRVLAPADDIKKVKSGLKETAKQLKRMDKKKLPKRKG